MKKNIINFILTFLILFTTSFFGSDSNNNENNKNTTESYISDIETVVKVLENPKSRQELMKRLRAGNNKSIKKPVKSAKEEKEDEVPLKETISTINEKVNITTQKITSTIPNFLDIPKDFKNAILKIIEKPSDVINFLFFSLVYFISLFILGFIINKILLNRVIKKKFILTLFLSRSILLFFLIFLLNHIFLTTYDSETSIIYPITQLSQFGFLCFLAIYLPIFTLDYIFDGKVDVFKKIQALSKKALILIILFFGFIELLDFLVLNDSSVNIFRETLFIFIGFFISYLFYKTKNFASHHIAEKIEKNRERINKSVFVILKSINSPNNLFVLSLFLISAMFFNYGDSKETLFAIFLINCLSIFTYWFYKFADSFRKKHIDDKKPIINLFLAVKAILTVFYCASILYFIGFDIVDFLFDQSTQMFIKKIFSVSLIIFSIKFLWHITKNFLDNMIKNNDENSYKIERFHPFIKNILGSMYVITAIVLICAEFGYLLTPILLSFTAISFSIGLAAQNVVKDVINGALIMSENNMKVGDIVEIGNPVVLGEVEKITLRTVYIRHGIGPVETVPFSDITRVVNRSQEYNYTVINFGVPHDADLNLVYKAIQNTSDELLSDQTLEIRATEPVVIRGISEVTDNMIKISGSIRTTQDPKNFFEREFNYRLKKHLDKLGIKQPVSKRMVKISDKAA